jgi:hypothetical protein
MPKRLLHSTVVLLAIAATGCAAYPGGLSGLAVPTVGTDQAGQPLSLSSLPKAGVSGVVMAPAHVVAAGGGNVVAAGGGNVVAAGGGNVIAAGGGNFAGTRRVLALDQQVAVVGAEVYLADLAGERLPGSVAAVTDAAGRFTLRGAPEDAPYMVVARFRASGGADVTLTRLGHPSRNGHDQVVSVATTLVSKAFVQRGTPAAHFDPDTFDAAVEAVAERLTEATLPDLTRPEDVAAKAAAIADDSPAVRQAIDAPAPASSGPAPEPLVDAPTGAVPPAPAGGHKGKSNGKGGGPSGPATPHAPEAPDASAGEPAPIDAAPSTEPPASEPGTGSGTGESQAPSQVTPEPPASQPPQAGPDKDKDKKPKKDKNKGKGGRPS